jgi:hypothetical protein
MARTIEHRKIEGGEVGLFREANLTPQLGLLEGVRVSISKDVLVALAPYLVDAGGEPYTARRLFVELEIPCSNGQPL